MTQEELREILDKHNKWLNKEEGGERADLGCVDLSEADLNGVNLRFADLAWANLRYAHLSDADLRNADFSGADLTGVDLCSADIRYANFLYADLREAGLSDADLRGADLRGVELRSANLVGADLRGAKVDLATWPLWCGSFGVKVDARIARQLAYHLCRIDCDDEEFLGVREAVKDFANKFHRVDECGNLDNTLQQTEEKK